MILLSPIKDHRTERRLFIGRTILASVISVMLLGTVIARLGIDPRLDEHAVPGDFRWTIALHGTIDEPFAGRAKHRVPYRRARQSGYLGAVGRPRTQTNSVSDTVTSCACIGFAWDTSRVLTLDLGILFSTKLDQEPCTNAGSRARYMSWKGVTMRRWNRIRRIRRA